MKHLIKKADWRSVHGCLRKGVVGLVAASLITLPAGVQAESATPSAETHVERTPSQVAEELAAQASENFDAGRYQIAADLWMQAVNILPEQREFRLQRAVMVENAAIALEEVAKQVQDDNTAVERERKLLSRYLETCVDVYGSTCNEFSETIRLRERLQKSWQMEQALQPTKAEIQRSIELGRTLGGNPVPPPRKSPEPVPKTAIAAFVFGFAMMGGGTALIIYGSGDQFLKANMANQAQASFRRFNLAAEDEPIDDSTDTDNTSGTPSSGTTNLTPTFQLSPKQKGGLMIGAGSFVAAMGIGLVVLGSMQVAKHRRLRRKYVQLSPHISPVQAGVVLSGRF